MKAPSPNNNLQETQSIESLMESETTTLIPQIDNKIPRNRDFQLDEVVRKYTTLKHQRNHYWSSLPCLPS